MASSPKLSTHLTGTGWECQTSDYRSGRDTRLVPVSTLGLTPPRTDRGSDLQRFGQTQFIWNKMLCWGTDLHVHVLQNEEAKVIQDLEAGAGASDRFAYTITLYGSAQTWTGCPIHLAASRGHVSMVKLLLDAGCDVQSTVQQDGMDHYDVIQAAVLKEGCGGSGDIIDFLCSRRADICSKHANGLTCLHLAFQTGNLQTIQAVRRHLLDQDEFSEMEDFTSTDRPKTPLEYGIQWGKMSRRALADAAALTFGSFKVFLFLAPECLPRFLSRLHCLLHGRPAEVLGDKLTHRDLGRLFYYPRIAIQVLEMCTATPMVTSQGRHPLPSRVSFPNENLLRCLGASERRLCFYENDRDWDFDDQANEAPSWHSKVIHVKDETRVDASILVCGIPNLINATVFADLASAAEHVEGGLELYDVRVIRAMITYTYWNGGCWMDVMQLFYSLWGLALLVLESHEGHTEAYMDLQMNDGVFAGVVTHWMVAKGIVDLNLEVAQIFGLVRAGMLSRYFTMGNAWDLTRSIAPILLLYLDLKLLKVLIVFIYWLRLLEGVILHKWIGEVLLPIQKLLIALVPALAFTLLCFGMMTHAMYAVQRVGHVWPDMIFQSFQMLVLQGLPDEPPVDPVDLMLCYGGVLFFSIFVLNIFIGVINEQYSAEASVAGPKFTGLRASSCLAFLLRASVIPTKLCTSSSAASLGTVLFGLALGLQYLVLCRGQQFTSIFQLLVFTACHLAVFLGIFQVKGSDYPWEEDLTHTYSVATCDCGPNRVPRYLWLVEPWDARLDEDLLDTSTKQPETYIEVKEPPNSEQDTEQLRSELREAVRELREVKNLLEKDFSPISEMHNPERSGKAGCLKWLKQHASHEGLPGPTLLTSRRQQTHYSK
eukprot:s5316_g1.t1